MAKLFGGDLTKLKNPASPGSGEGPARVWAAFLAASVVASLGSLHALDVFGFQPFLASNHFEGHHVALIEGFEA
jgi:hypothetical protein